MEKEREQLISDLNEAMGQVKKLSGLLPICSFCKKIRDENDTGASFNPISRIIPMQNSAAASAGNVQRNSILMWTSLTIETGQQVMADGLPFEVDALSSS